LETLNRLLSEIGRTQRISILRELKRGGPLPVKALAKRLSMSYMGVKQHCVGLERDGYLDTWRNPKPIGRPELLYRLTKKARELFPAASNAMTLAILDAARQLYGPTAPGKLLFLYFREQGERYLAKVRGDEPAERAKWLARLRNQEGCMATFVTSEGVRIIERHSPIRDVVEAYPEAGNFEREMFERVIGAPIERDAREEGGEYECVFGIS
jgi:predicted ArsR family transcriptional regulator